MVLLYSCLVPHNTSKMSAADFENAKAYLLQASSTTGQNLYEHMVGMISKVLDERPTDAIDRLEDLSLQVKAGQFVNTASTVKDVEEPSGEVTLAQKQEKMYEKGEEEEIDEDSEPVIDDVISEMQLFNDAGVGLSREESFRVFLSMKQLQGQQSFQKIRFWGVIYGLQKNYYVAECVYTEGEEPQPEEEEEEQVDDGAGGDGEEDPDALPKSQYQAPKPLAKEEYGKGANKYAYYVCNEPGDVWTALPMVTPAQIVVARQVKKYFTGNLDTPIESYPPFDGTEKEYLRAQIACISSDTVVSPQGLFTFDEEDEDEEEAPDTYIKDEEYEGLPQEKLLDQEGEGPDGWVHHVQHILPQGRCKWINPNPKPEDEGDDDEDEDEDEEDEVVPETGPALLSSIMQDPQVDGLPAWSARLTSEFNKRFAGVMVASNIWPGAYAVAYNKAMQFANVYFGDGHKYSATPYNPPAPPTPEAEFTTDEATTEATDPTREEEEVFEAAQNAKEEDDEDEEDED